VGYDAGKKIKGRKRFMTVDTGRIGAAVKVLPPVYQNGQAANKCKERVKQMGDQVSRLTTIWTDGGNDCPAFMMWVMDVCRWIVHLRAATPCKLRGSSCSKSALVVERTYGKAHGVSPIGQRL